MEVLAALITTVGTVICLCPASFHSDVRLLYGGPGVQKCKHHNLKIRINITNKYFKKALHLTKHICKKKKRNILNKIQ